MEGEYYVEEKKPKNYKMYYIGEDDLTYENKILTEICDPVEFLIICPICENDWLKKDTIIKGKRYFQCKQCGKRFVFYKDYKNYIIHESIKLMLKNNYSMARMARRLKMHPTTIRNYLNKYDLIDEYERKTKYGLQDTYIDLSDDPEYDNCIDDGDMPDDEEYEY